MGTLIEKIANCACLDQKAKYPSPYSFNFQAGKELPNNRQLFESNQIQTSKYTVLTFLPKALMLQFKRLANVYFLIVSILLSIKIISPINPLTAWSPLLIVIGISMIRQGYEDYQRHVSDYKNNHEQKTIVLREGKATEVEWSEVVVGDICIVQNQEMFPADMILLCSSNHAGVAHIETASLDGQKNLKPRNAYPQTYQRSDEEISKLTGTFTGDEPNKNLHQFSGEINLPNCEPILLSGDKQLLYRGARLKNTKKVHGLVIYTGKNTKIILNSESESEKMSQVEVKVNYVLGLILIIQIALCVICAAGYVITRNNSEQNDYYVSWPNWGVALDGFLIFLTYFVLLNTMIPISLIVTMEMVKLFQKYFIEKDKLMYSGYRDKYVSVQSASLNEQLGQIQYVFTDKTGTLTMNIMEFKIAVIGSHLFGDTNLVTDNEDGKPLTKGFSDQTLKKMLTTGAGDKPLYQQITVANKQGSDRVTFKKIRQLAEQYFILLGLTHEVVPDVNKLGAKIYQGPSPDEVALVDAAREMEYEFIQAGQNQTVIKVRGRQKKFELLNSFLFTSDRKRMSIIVRDPRDKRIKMFIKGADSIIKERLSKHQKLNLDAELQNFSKIGLRTLLVGMRLISEQEYKDFQNKLKKIPQAQRQKQSVTLIDQLERDIYLIGATAVLDRLQDDVPETIRDMIRANIKVWMLTGDKMETAENIAKSCRLIQQNFNILRLKLGDRIPKIDTSRILNEKQDTQISTITLKELQRLSNEATSPQNQSNALMIEGSDLTHVLRYHECKKQLAALSEKCKAVVCCRLLPIQKAEVVSLVRQYLGKITLAIGDGANDVPMIKTAHIGIGLYGQEGMGAVQASDYALPEFRMLWRLLFVHGRWNYIRISEMILYFFYKNMLFTLPQFIAAFFNGFSGQTIFDDIYITLYNLLFTAMPLLIRAVLEQDVNYIYYREPEHQALEPPLTQKSLINELNYLPQRFGINKNFYRLFPKIYFIGQENCIFNYKNFFTWILEGIAEAILISLFCFYILDQMSLNSTGISSDYWLIGITIYSSVILVVTLKLATHTRFWSACLIFSILVLSLGCYAAYMWLSNYFLSAAIVGTTFVAWTTGEVYFLILFCICVILLVDGIVVFMDFRRGSYASKMREVIYSDQINNRYFYDKMSLFITQGLTEQQKR